MSIDPYAFSMDPYSEFADVVPVAQAPIIYQGRVSYDTRFEGVALQHFKETQARRFALAIMRQDKFYTTTPQPPGRPWLVDQRFKALVLTETEWAAELAKAYNKGVLAAHRMVWKP